VDEDGDGIANEWDVYDHQVRDMSIRFSDSVDYTYDIPLIDAGDFFRIFVLLDNDYFDMSVRYSKHPLNVDDPFIHSGSFQNVYVHHGLTNQMAKEDFVGCPSPPCRIRYFSSFNVFRGVDIWGGTVVSNPSYPEGSECSYEEE